MLVYLSLLVCALSGDHCYVTVPHVEPAPGLAACQIEGMKYGPEWLRAHPGMRIEKYRCSIGRRPHPEDET